MIPNAHFHLPIWKYVLRFPMLHPIYPHALILSLIFAGINPISMLYTIFKVTIISAIPRCPFEIAMSIHFVVGPLANILVAIGPYESTLTVNCVLDPVTSVFASIATGEFSVTAFLVVYVIADEDGAIFLCFGTVSVSFIVFPFAIVGAAFCFVEEALSGGYALAKVAFVNVSVGVNHDSIAFVEAVFPIALVFVAICVEFDAVTVSFVFCVPLAFIGRAIGHFVLGPTCELYVIDILEAITLSISWALAAVAKVHASCFAF